MDQQKAALCPVLVDQRERRAPHAGGPQGLPHSPDQDGLARPQVPLEQDHHPGLQRPAQGPTQGPRGLLR